MRLSFITQLKIEFSLPLTGCRKVLGKIPDIDSLKNEASFASPLRTKILFLGHHKEGLVSRSKKTERSKAAT